MNGNTANMNSVANPRIAASDINDMIPSAQERQVNMGQNARDNGDVDLANENSRLRDMTGMYALLAMLFFIKCFYISYVLHMICIFTHFSLYSFLPPLFFVTTATITIAAVMERLNDTESLLAASEAEAIYYQMQHQQEQHKLQTLLRLREETEATSAAAGMCANGFNLLWWNVANHVLTTDTPPQHCISAA
jgi:hypothetical protein